MLLKRSALGIAFLLVAAGCAGEAGLGTARGFNVSLLAPEKRWSVPPFSGERLHPERAARITRSYVQGRVSVVNFWGSWCGPCRKEQPALNRLAAEYEPQGVRFLGVNVRDPRANALAYREEFDVPYPSIFSPDAGVAFAFRVRLMPTTYVLDREGRVAARIVGALRSEADLTRVLDAELAAGP